MATIAYQSKTKTYRVQIITPDHRRVGKSGFRTKTEARSWLRDNELKIVTGKSDVTDSHELLSDYFKRWYETYKTDVTDVTLIQYRATLTAIKTYLPRARLNTFNRQTYQKFLNAYGKDHAKQTVAKRKTQLSASLKDAFIDKLIVEDPTVRLSLTGKSGKTAEFKFLEAGDFINLEHYVYQDLDRSSQLAIFIAIHTGLRIGEIKALTIKDVDFVHSTLSVNQSMDVQGHLKSPKTEASNRTIKIDQRLLDVFKRLESVSGLLVQSSQKYTNKVLNDDLSAIKAKHVTFHALRHSHASYLLSKGVSIRYVSERLGHGSVAITENVYAHLLKSLRENEENKVTDLMNFQ